MPRLIVSLVIVLALAGGGFFLYQNLQTKPVYQTSPSPQAISTPSPSVQSPTATSPSTKSDPCEVLTKGSTDVPPLYKEGVSWQQPKMTKQEVEEFQDPSLGLGFSSQPKDGCSFTSGQLSSEVANKIFYDYLNKLKQLNWKEVSGADAPGSSTNTLKKDNKYFVIKVDPVKMEPLTQIVTLFYTP